MLLEENDFEIDEDNMSPQAFEVLVEKGIEWLHPEDLKEFDEAIDEFCNGEYYNVRTCCISCILYCIYYCILYCIIAYYRNCIFLYYLQHIVTV
jgi:hypothetical protein